MSERDRLDANVAPGSLCINVGSEVARLVALALATVRRSNVVCGFPAPRFHEDSFFRDAIEGIN